MSVHLAVLGLLALLLLVGGLFYLLAKIIALGTLILGGLPALLFLLLQYLIPCFCAIGGAYAWRTVVGSAVLGSALVPISVAVFSVAGAGEKFMGVPVPWPTAYALGSSEVTLSALKRASIPYVYVYAAAFFIAVVVRGVQAFRVRVHQKISSPLDSDAAKPIAQRRNDLR